MEENPKIVAKYEQLEALGKKLFAGQSLNFETITQAQVKLAKEFLRKGATTTNPEVNAFYWEHILLAPELGKRIAEKLTKGSSVNPYAIEFLLFLHDIGRLITPSAYFKNDLIGDRLLLEIGLEKELVDDLPPLGRISVLADEEEFTDEQLNFSQPLTSEQKKTIQKYFEALTPTQRIINLADNLGKRNNDGIFNFEAFKEYLKTQEKRYAHESHWACIHWAIIRRKGAALLEYHLVKKTFDWLKNEGIDVNKILEELKDYGPKFVLIVRHGELDNPEDIVYNRDSVMKTPMHLSTIGEKHMYELGQLIKAKGFNLTRIFSSPEIRAQESVAQLNKTLKLPVEIVNDLDDVYAPDPYNEGWKMDKLIALGGNSYNLPHTERPENLVRRMLDVFNMASDSLKTGQSTILLSHGDPIAFLVYMLKTNSVLNPEKIRQVQFPKKGQVMVTVIGANKKLLTLYLLNPDIEENSY